MAVLGRRVGGWREGLAVTLPFLFFFYWQLARHAMWRDEVNAFALAAASPGLPALFRAIHYEAHPWLWYVLLWLVSKVTVLPVGMKVLEAVVGTGIYLVLGVLSPFRWFEKVLIFLSAFVAFEYTVLSRMYGVMLLLTLVYVWRRTRWPERVVGNLGLLGLLACSDLSGMALSGALLLEYGWARWRPQAGKEPVRRGRMALGALLYGALALSAVVSLLPAKDISRTAMGGTFTQIGNGKHLLDASLNYVAMPYAAVRTLRSGRTWNPLAETRRGSMLVLEVLVLAGYWYVFRRRASLRVLVFAVCVLGVAIGHVVFHGAMRHFGITYVGFVCGLWMLRAAGEKVSWPAYGLLGLCAAGGVVLSVASFERPFSRGRDAADWIAAHGRRDGLIVGSPMTTTVGVAEQLARPMYSVECGRVEAYFVFTSACDGYKPAMLPARLRDASALARGGSVTFVGDEPLTAGQVAGIEGAGLRVRELAGFGGAEAEEEDFYLYSVDRVGPAASGRR